MTQTPPTITISGGLRTAAFIEASRRFPFHQHPGILYVTKPLT